MDDHQTLDDLDSELIQRLNKTSRLGGIEYKIAVTSAEYKACHALARESDIEASSGFRFPTIMAMKDGDLIGFVSTYTTEGMVALGPLVLKTDRPHPIIALRLLEAFDAVMQNIGIEWYIFYVGTDSHLKQYADRLDMPMYATQDGNAYYLRDFNHGNESRSSEGDRGGEPSEAATGGPAEEADAADQEGL